MKKLVIIIFFIIFTGLYYSYNSQINKCENREISILDISSDSFQRICNYNEKTLNYLTRGEKFDIDLFFELSKMYKNSGNYIIKNSDFKNISLIQKIQLYYILKNIYNFDDNYIEKNIGIIVDNKYKNYFIGLDRIISAENLLTQVFEGEEDTINGIKPASGKLSYEDLQFLDTIFKLEPERFDSINLVSDLEGGYSILSDEKSKELYIIIIENLLNSSVNKQSKEILNNFLKSHK